MSENDYEYQCMRAELLGLPKPDTPDPSLSCSTAAADVDGNDLEESPPVDELDLDVDSERFTRTSGGLDEINNILQTTQKKINKFKTVFGSVTSLLKGRVSAEGSTENLRDTGSSTSSATTANTINTTSTNDDETLGGSDTGEVVAAPTTVGSRPAKKIDVESMLSSHIQTLDSMVYKADNINLAMNQQNKQMKHVLNK